MVGTKVETIKPRLGPTCPLSHPLGSPQTVLLPNDEDEPGVKKCGHPPIPPAVVLSPNDCVVVLEG